MENNAKEERTRINNNSENEERDDTRHEEPMVHSIPRQGRLRNRTESNFHRNTYEVEFQGAHLMSTVPINPHATPHRFSIPTLKQTRHNATQCTNITPFLLSAKRNKTKKKGNNRKKN